MKQMNSTEFQLLLKTVLCLVAQSCPTLCNPTDCCPLGSSVHGDSPGKNTRVGCHALLQRIFPTQGWNPGIPHCRQILYHLSHQGNPFENYSISNLLSLYLTCSLRVLIVYVHTHVCTGMSEVGRGPKRAFHITQQPGELEFSGEPV